jgi:glycosyltransferase involved in cell wall biosynthesis
MRVIVIIPALNEALHIAALVRAVRRHCPEVLVVDDGSSDDTSAMAASAGAAVIPHPVNRGKGVALATGFTYAVRNGFDAVITLDGDAQHDPEELPLFIDVAERTGADMVLGNRMHSTARMPFIRWATNVLTSLCVNVVGGVCVHDSQVGYRLVRTRLLRRMRLRSGRYEQESEIIIRAARMGFRIKEAPIRTIYLGGPSKIRPFRDTVRFLRLVFGFLK